MTKIVAEYERSYCSEPKLEQIGVILHCYMCKNNSYIDLNCCDNPKIYTDEKNIICVSCKKILPNTSENDMKIFKENEKIIDKRSENMFYILHDYAFNPEIRDLGIEEKICIFEIIKMIIINQTKSSDFEIKLNSNKYMLIKILEIFAINIDEELCYSEKLLNLFENRFQKLMRYSIYDIAKILNIYEIEYELNMDLIMKYNDS